MTRRRRRWLVGLGILVVVRAALPLGLRALLASQASTLLDARVEVGDVDLALLRGAVALEDVAVRPPVPPGAEPQARDDTEPPLVAWKRFAVNLSWLPLFWKTVELRSVELDAPRIALDRLASGAINLMALVPKAKAPAAEAPAAEQPGAEQPAEKKPVEGKPAGERSGWGVGVDRLVLRDGRVRFRDFAVADAAPVDVSLPTIVVRDVSLRPGLYGEPARVHLEVRVDEGRLRASTRLGLREDGLAVATSLRARRLPLGRTRLYVPKVGWRELEGALGASLVHRFATGGRHDVRGTVALDDVTVRVPEMEDPALAWKRFAVTVDPVDVVAERAAVASVELAGASVLVRPRGGAPLPVAEGAIGGAPAAEPAPPAEPAPAPSKPWRWSIASLRVTGTRVRLLGDGEEAPTDVGVDLEARDLAGDGDAVAPVLLGLTVGEGSLGVEGGLRIAQPGFAGTLALERLSVPELATLAGALPPNVLQKGVLGAQLAVAAGSSAPTPGDVRVQGKIGLAEPWVAAADPWEFAMGAAALDVGIDDLVVPGVMAAGGAGPQPGPIRVHLGAVEVAKPYVKVTRTPDGIVLPPLSAAEQRPAAAKEPPAAPAAPGAAPAAAVDVLVDVFRLTQGSILVTDRTVKPFFSGGLVPLEIDARKLRWPALAIERLRLEATSATRGKLVVTGGFSPAGGQVEVNGKEIALQPFNPYATAYSPYSIASGALSVATKARLAKGGYDADTSLTLHGFDLGGKEGDTLFAQQFGIPLSVALALLKDLQGNIGLDVALETDEQGTKVGLVSIVGQALRKALIGALASPLKLIGAAFGGGGEGLAPAPIAFRPGRADPAPEGEAQVEALAGFLASRPGIGITLEATPAAADVRWLREQALREELGAPQGVLGAVRNLPQRGARERIRTALEARARDEERVLSPEDAATLEEWLAERPAPAPERLRRLAAERLARIATVLGEKHGIGPERVARREPGADVRDDPPAVRFEIGAASEIAARR